MNSGNNSDKNNIIVIPEDLFRLYNKLGIKKVNKFIGKYNQKAANMLTVYHIRVIVHELDFQPWKDLTKTQTQLILSFNMELACMLAKLINSNYLRINSDLKKFFDSEGVNINPTSYEIKDHTFE